MSVLIEGMDTSQNGVWVHAADRLPEKSGLYLVCVNLADRFGNDFRFVDCAHYRKDEGLWVMEDRADCVYNAYIEHVNKEEVSYITHWMSLPEPPRM